MVKSFGRIPFARGIFYDFLMRLCFLFFVFSAFCVLTVRSAGADPAVWSAPFPAPDSVGAEDPVPESVSLASSVLLERPAESEADLSSLEAAYAERFVDAPRQFGYSLFANSGKDPPRDRPALPAGAAQDDVLLNFGDSLRVAFRGQRTDSGVYRVDNDGAILLPDLEPISAAGRSLGDVREGIERAISGFHNTKASVSLASVRQIEILVVGHVARPGRQILTPFHSVLDALTEAGGVEKTGSLRRIKLVRAGRSALIDLYGLLMYGSDANDMGLQDGDRIIVPPIGPTLAVAGEVKRPGIYEILPLPRGLRAGPQDWAESLSLNDLLDLGGGVLAPGRNRFLRMSLTPDGHEAVEEVSDSLETIFSEGDILNVARGGAKRAGTVTLSGNVRRPGLYALDRTPTLSALLDGEAALGPRVYPLIGVIERWDPHRLTGGFLDFPPDKVLSHAFDRKLSDGDTVHLFSMEDIRGLEADTAKAEESAYGSADGGEGLDSALAGFLRERRVRVGGAVRGPGAFPVSGGGASLESLVAVAGGLGLDADPAAIEVAAAHSSPGEAARKRVALGGKESAIVLKPGDSVRVAAKFKAIRGKTVTIGGEVRNPGAYDLMAGDRLSDLLARAGGITAQSYPEGAIFSRESERQAEESRFRAAAQDMERAIAASVDSGKAGEKPDVSQVALARDLAAELRAAQGAGRITVEADPGRLAAQPELDILLESGDRIYIPARPLTVRVSGEVLSPASLQFRKGKDARDYIDEAGGFSFHADKGRVFVVYPDGSAQPLSVDSWNHRPALIPPGSTIVVPRDPKPFDFLDSAEKVTHILSNLALTGIWLDDIRNGN